MVQALGAVAAGVAVLALFPGPVRADLSGAGTLTGMPVADPDTVVVAEGSRYISYGSKRPTNACAGGRCWVPYVVHGQGSTVGLDGTIDGDAMPAGPGRWVSRPNGLWAPSVIHHNGGYLLFYSSSKKGTVSPARPKGRKCIGVARAESARGPFRADPEPLLCSRNGWSLDAEAFTSRRGGRLHVVYRHDAAATGRRTAISVTTIDDAARRVLARTRLLTSGDITWDRPDEPEGDGGIVENPSMIRANGRWWLFYSGNRWPTDRYSTGIARCSTDGPHGECTPVPSRHRPWFGYTGAGGLTGEHRPVAELPGNGPGPGGMAVFRARDNTMRVIWHVHPSDPADRRFSLTGVLLLDAGNWAVEPES